MDTNEVKEEPKEIHHYYHKDDNTPKKWCTVKFITGFIKHKFIAFVVTTAMVLWIILWLMSLLSNPTQSISSELMIFFYIIGGVWGLVTIVFILSGAIDNAVYNAKIDLQIKAEAKKVINTETAKVIEAVKGAEK